MRGELHELAWLVNSLLKCSLSVFRVPKRFYLWQVWRSMTQVGYGSIAIVTVIAFCVGVILALHAANQLERFGATSYVANLVGVIIITELGPLLTAVVITGRSGAAFTAEIATMKISEEIDALDVMGVDAVQFLVWPKLLAMVIMLPVLTVWADFVGIGSSMLYSGVFLSMSFKEYFLQSANFLRMSDLLSGLVKSLGFGLAITIICCWQGFLAREGAADVGRRTTRSVVQSIFVIILLDLYFTALTYAFN